MTVARYEIPRSLVERIHQQLKSAYGYLHNEYVFLKNLGKVKLPDVPVT